MFWNLFIDRQIKVSILDATDRVAVRTKVCSHEGIAVEAEAARTATVNRTTPIEADGTHIDERSIAVAAVARHGQFKRRLECSGSIIG